MKAKTTTEAPDFYSKFNWSQHAADVPLRSCSFAAQGFWIRLLGIMFESGGQLLIGGRQPDTRQLCRQTGGLPDEVEELLNELEAAGVFSRYPDGTIYSRRMVRDFAKRETARVNGVKGGNKSLTRADADQRGVIQALPDQDNPPVNPQDNPQDKPQDIPGVNPEVKPNSTEIETEKDIQEAPLPGAGAPRSAGSASLFEALPEQPTPKALCYSEGLELLSQLNPKGPRLPEGRDRLAAQITDFLTQCRGDAGLLLGILRDTAGDPPRSPIPWIKTMITTAMHRKGERPSGTPVSTGDTPRLVVSNDPNDPRGIKAWCVASGFPETQGPDTQIGGWYSPDQRHIIDRVARNVAEAAKLPYGWRGDWNVLLGWLNDGIPREEIVSFISRWAGRSDYEAPTSLRMFDRALRERRAA